MTFEIALLLGLIIVAVVCFCFEWVSADVVALGLLLTLMLTGLLPADKAFSGFGSDTVIMIIGLLIMTAALLKAGVVDLVGRFILRHVGKGVNLLLLAIMLSVATLSAFISNTAAAAFFVPIAIGIATKAGIAPSRLLMPVAFAAILTSSVSLISTSTNLVVSGLMTNAGLQPMGMFELAPVGIPIAVVGLAYMFFVGRHWIPNRTAPGGLIEGFGIRSYLTELLVLPKSRLAGKRLAESGLGADLDLDVLRIVRNKDQYLLPRDNMVIEAGDVLLVEGPRAEVLKVKDTAGIEIKADVKLSDPNLRSEDTALVEALVVPGSPLIGETLRDMNFRHRYGLQVLGLNRHGKNVHQKLSRIPFRVGDVLLIQGRKTNIPALNDDGMFSILGEIEEKRPDRMRALRTGLIFCGALLLATFNVVSLPVAMLLGAFCTFAAKCVTPSEAYREVEWRAVILIASMLALGEAMTTTGTARYLAELVASGTAGLHPIWLLGGVFLLTVLLTQPMSNQAAAAVILPIAVHTAEQLHLNPRAFAMMIAVAASCSYLTPLEPACLMVYGPGRYRFSDFFRVGTPLVILLFALAMWLVPKYWPLTNL
ncbi:MAG: SLC13 family permease [Verrucomicrobiota bacterium]